MNVIDKVFGVSPSVLSIRAQRFGMISANIANADTPGYKAVDIDFSQALARVQGGSVVLGGTNPRHIGMTRGRPEVIYTTPTQASLDGNTVETDVEQAKFMDNAIRYQASLRFLGGRVKSLLFAIKGE